jgi:hypothetical protein
MAEGGFARPGRLRPPSASPSPPAPARSAPCLTPAGRAATTYGSRSPTGTAVTYKSVGDASPSLPKSRQTIISV